jgi:hypothetical protein
LAILGGGYWWWHRRQHRLYSPESLAAQLRAEHVATSPQSLTMTTSTLSSILPPAATASVTTPSASLMTPPMATRRLPLLRAEHKRSQSTITGQLDL